MEMYTNTEIQMECCTQIQIAVQIEMYTNTEIQMECCKQIQIEVQLEMSFDDSR